MAMKPSPRKLSRATVAAALSATAAVVALITALSACGGSSGNGQGTASKAQPKGTTITVYSGRQEELVGPLFRRYEIHSGDEIKVRYGDSAELAQTILEEGKNSPADVYFSQDAGALGALQKENRLVKLPRRILKKVEPRFRSRTGRWVGTSARARIVAYNRDNLKESDLPESILGFTDPKWKGRIGWAPTNASFQAFVTGLRWLKGDEVAEKWLESIVANKPQVYENNIAVRDAVASGEIDVGFINHYYVAQAYAEKGEDYPVGIYYPPRGDPGSLVNVAGAGVLNSSKKKRAALRLVAFLLSGEAQRYFASETKEYPVVKSIPADRELTPLKEIEQPDIDLSDLDDLKGTLKLLEKAGVL